MNKEEYIQRRGIAAYEKHLQRNRKWLSAHHEEHKQKNREWTESHPEQVQARSQEQSHKGGRFYECKLKYQTTGIPGEKNVIRMMHRKHYCPYKKIIAPDSQIHHEWIPETANYRGVALVEKEPHQYGIIDVIHILEGEITLLTEEEIRNRGA